MGGGRSRAAQAVRLLPCLRRVDIIAGIPVQMATDGKDCIFVFTGDADFGFADCIIIYSNSQQPSPFAITITVVGCWLLLAIDCWEF
jgi:hypothetical protein